MLIFLISHQRVSITSPRNTDMLLFYELSRETEEWLFKRFLFKAVDTVFNLMLEFSPYNQFSVSFPKYMFCSINVCSPVSGILTVSKALLSSLPHAGREERSLHQNQLLSLVPSAMRVYGPSKAFSKSN